MPVEGGAERQLRQVVDAISRDGSSVVVITQVVSGRPRREILESGVLVHRTGARWSLSRSPRWAQASFFVGAIVAGFGYRPRVLLSLQLGAASVAAGIIARARARPHILRLTGGGSARFRSEPLEKAASHLGRALGRVFSRPGTTVVAPAKHLLADFAEAFPGYPCELKYVPNGVSAPAATIQKDQEVIWYSRGGSEKSTETFCLIAALLPDITFTVMGSEPSFDLPANVNFIGWQKRPEEAIGRHRVLLNTSPQEGMPNTALQAISMGCRVVGFENAGLSELREMYPASVTLVGLGDVSDSAEAVRVALSLQPMQRIAVVSVSEVVHEWMNLITSKRVQGL